MRALVLVVLLLGAGCEDIRTFEGDWIGPRVGGPEVSRGFGESVSADLTIDNAGLDALAGRLSTSDGLLDNAPTVAIPEAEADSLVSLTFWGAPLRVFLAFAPTTDGAGDVLVLVGLFPDDRIELRLMRGGAAPRYGVFSLQPQ